MRGSWLRPNKTVHRESAEAVKRYRASQALRERLDLFVALHDDGMPMSRDEWCRTAVDAVLANYRGE